MMKSDDESHSLLSHPRGKLKCKLLDKPQEARVHGGIVAQVAGIRAEVQEAIKTIAVEVIAVPVADKAVRAVVIRNAVVPARVLGVADRNVGTEVVADVHSEVMLLEMAEAREGVIVSPSRTDLSVRRKRSPFLMQCKRVKSRFGPLVT